MPENLRGIFLTHTV